MTKARACAWPSEGHFQGLTGTVSQFQLAIMQEQSL